MPEILICASSQKAWKRKTDQGIKSLCLHLSARFYYAPTMEKDVLMKVLGSTLEESRVTIEEEKIKNETIT